MRPVVSMGHILRCLYFIQSTSFSESKYALFLSVVVCQPGRWLPTLAIVLCSYSEVQNLFYADWLFQLAILASGWRRGRELVCHIDYLLLMRAKIARNASSSIDGTYLALSILHPEHVFLWYSSLIRPTCSFYTDWLDWLITGRFPF